MTNSLFVQIAMIVLAVCIVVLYIKPEIAQIRAIQDKTAVYTSEIEKVSNVNTTLSDHVKAIDAIPTDDKSALITYLPNAIDEIVIMRDLEAIVAESGVDLAELAYGGETQKQNNSGNEAPVSALNAQVTPHTFTVGVSGSYEAIKGLLALLEVNKYQLQVAAVDFTPQESDVLDAKISLVVYSMNVTATEASTADNLDTEDPTL